MEIIAYFDASALIYFIEGAEPFANRTRMELAKLEKRYPALKVAVGRLSWLECRVRPARQNDLRTLGIFDEFFARPDLTWIEVTREVVELATAIRVKHGLRTPDALQAACCLQLGVRHLFLTGESSFKKIDSLNVVMLT